MPFPPLPTRRPPDTRPLLCVVEGRFDEANLLALADALHHDDPECPDLRQLTHAGRILWLPIGGGDLAGWDQRLAPLGCPEFHLYDREQSPETERRLAVIDRLNARPRCRAVLTHKRALENYLHAHAIARATGHRLPVDNQRSVPEQLVRQTQEINQRWPELSRRSRQRLMNRAKRALGPAFGHMTSAWLTERDPDGDVRG